MYGLNKKTDLSFLIERQLEQVAIGLHQVQLNFDQDVSISLECKFDHTSNGKSLITSENLPSSASSLLQLIGSKLIRVENHGNGDIEITFSDQNIVKIFDSNKSFESYQISSPSINLII
ncbi:MAG: DUF6188 family protein [Nitrospinota bacterium]|nr:DUF6188 family protein [Nitrospinota bacterium]